MLLPEKKYGIGTLRASTITLQAHALSQNQVKLFTAVLTGMNKMRSCLIAGAIAILFNRGVLFLSPHSYQQGTMCTTKYLVYRSVVQMTLPGQEFLYSLLLIISVST